MRDIFEAMNECFDNMRIGLNAELMKAHDKEIGGLFNELSAEGKREVVSFSDDLAMSAAEPDEAVESIAALTKKIHAQENGDITQALSAKSILDSYDDECVRLFVKLSKVSQIRIEALIWELAVRGEKAPNSMEDIMALTKKIHAEENPSDEEIVEAEVLDITILSQEYTQCDCGCGKYYLKSVDASLFVKCGDKKAWSKPQRVGALDGGRSYKFLDRAAEHEMLAAGLDDFMKYLGDEIYKRTFGNPDYAIKDLNAF